MCDLSIIIVSYNNWNVLQDCLRSIMKTNDIGEKQEVIVVEQSPQDSIYEGVKQEFPWVKLLRAENKGFGAGNNRGFEVSHGKFVLFLNPDTILIEPISRYAVDKFESDDSLGVFGLQLRDAQKKKTESFNVNIPYGFWNKLLFYVCLPLGLFIEKKMYIQGADTFIRSELFDSVGRFDENVFMYGEEPDLCTRVIKKGYHVRFDPSRSIVHLQGACSPNNYTVSFGKKVEAFKYFCQKNNYPFQSYVHSEIAFQKTKQLILGVLGRKQSTQYSLSKAIVDVLKNYR